MDSLVVQLLDRVQEMADNPNDITGVPTGFHDLDRMTSGLQAGDLVILAARPSMGKTSLAINIAEHVALNEGLPVAVFSMEMGASQLAVRIVGSIGRIDQTHLRTGRLTDDEWPRLTEAIEKLRNVSLHIDETPGLTTSELRANARRLARQCGKLGMIVVDYLQLMSVSSDMSDENRATAVGEISRGLKMLAKELQCPVIALSQLSRGVESRTDKRPMMSDLRESGAIEQDADVIMFIYRDEYYNKDSKEPGVAEIIIGKQRNGPVGTVKLTFLKPLTKFDNLAPGSVGSGDY
jgi:replicative DNA helicase